MSGFRVDDAPILGNDVFVPETFSNLRTVSDRGRIGSAEVIPFLNIHDHTLNTDVTPSNSSPSSSLLRLPPNSLIRSI